MFDLFILRAPKCFDIVENISIFSTIYKNLESLFSEVEKDFSEFSPGLFEKIYFRISSYVSAKIEALRIKGLTLLYKDECMK